MSFCSYGVWHMLKRTHSTSAHGPMDRVSSLSEDIRWIEHSNIQWAFYRNGGHKNNNEYVCSFVCLHLISLSFSERFSGYSRTNICISLRCPNAIKCDVAILERGWMNKQMCRYTVCSHASARSARWFHIETYTHNHRHKWQFDASTLALTWMETTRRVWANDTCVCMCVCVCTVQQQHTDMWASSYTTRALNLCECMRLSRVALENGHTIPYTIRHRESYETELICQMTSDTRKGLILTDHSI